MAVSEQDVLGALRPIVDPDFGKSIVDLGFIKNLRIEGARVAFDIELTTPACPVKHSRAARVAIAALPGCRRSRLTMTSHTRQQRRRRAAAQGDILPASRTSWRSRRARAVSAGTVAVNLALACARAARASAMDADTVRRCRCSPASPGGRRARRRSSPRATG
jgi:ATP-binding protein involved in chromosome partitioning